MKISGEHTQRDSAATASPADRTWWARLTEPPLPADLSPDERRRYRLTGRFTLFNFIANIAFLLNDWFTVGDPVILWVDAVAVPFFGWLHVRYLWGGSQRSTAILLLLSLNAWLFFNASYYGEESLIWLFLFTLLLLTFYLIEMRRWRSMALLMALPAVEMIVLEASDYGWFTYAGLTPEMVRGTRMLSVGMNLFLLLVFLDAILRNTLDNEARLLADQRRLQDMAARLQELNDLKEAYNSTLQQRLGEALAEVRAKEQALDRAAMEGEERERLRIAQELHDGVGATLGTLKLKLGDFRDLVRDERRGEYAQAIALIDAASQEVRNASHNMQPLLLEQLGLVSVLQDLADKFSTANGPRIQVETAGYTQRVPMATKRVLYRIVQELLNNALRHAQATRISIQLRSEAGATVLTVEDDGRGYDTGATPPGLGLRSIERRATALGGTVDVESAPGRGTLTIVEIPYTP